MDEVVKEYKCPVKRQMSSEDIMSIRTTIVNTVLYAGKLLRQYILNILTTHTKRVAMCNDRCVNPMVVIISQNVCIYQIIRLYPLRNVIYQIHLSKAGKKKKSEKNNP